MSISRERDSIVTASYLFAAHKVASLPEQSTDPGRYFLFTRNPLASCLQVQSASITAETASLFHGVVCIDKSEASRYTA